MLAVTAVQPSAIVASCQFGPKLFDVHGNIAVAQQLVYEAAGKGARVIVLPESCVGGYAFQSAREASSVCQTKDGYQTEAFVPLAQKFGCHIVFGYIELCDGKLYNSAAIVGPTGLEGNAQKHNLYGPDAFYAQPSEAMPPIVITAAGRTGVLICKDVKNRYRESYYAFNPQHRFYQKGSVDTICLPTNWGSSFGFPDSSWIDLVEETRANLIVSNRIGKERDMSFKGGALVIDRDRQIYSFGSSFDSESVVGGMVKL